MIISYFFDFFSNSQLIHIIYNMGIRGKIRLSKL